jgi:ketosteroid isomerase-like protein
MTSKDATYFPHSSEISDDGRPDRACGMRQTPTVSSETEHTRALLTEFYDLVMAGDLNGLLTRCVHSEIVAYEPAWLPHAGVHRGREAFARDILPAAANLLELNGLTIESITADPERAVAVVRANVIGVTDQVILGEHWTVADDKLAALRVFVHDPEPLLRRMRT